MRSATVSRWSSHDEPSESFGATCWQKRLATCCPCGASVPSIVDGMTNSMIGRLLYRLLFVGYAQDRNLLPDQREPYKSYSLSTMRLDIAERRDCKQVFS